MTGDPVFRRAAPPDASALAEAVERTDGAGNEEREPDVRYLWRP